VNRVYSRITSWIRSLSGSPEKISRPSNWVLPSYSFRMDWFSDTLPGVQGAVPVVPADSPKPVSVEAFARLNALWEEQNWSTGGELHLSLDEYRDGIRARAANEPHFEGRSADRVVDFYVRRSAWEGDVPNSGDFPSQSSKL